MSKPSPLELRIKSTAAFTRELSTRLEPHGGGHSHTRAFAADMSWIGADERPWIRRFAYCAFAVAIALPWILFLANQVFG